MLEIILCVALAAIWITIVWWEIRQNGLKEMAIQFILEAEKTLENNEEKFDMVCSKVIALLPSWLSFFITPNMVEKLVQHTFDTIKDVLDYRGNETTGK